LLLFEEDLKMTEESSENKAGGESHYIV